jgi:hypothetical protein
MQRYSTEEKARPGATCGEFFVFWTSLRQSGCGEPCVCAFCIVSYKCAAHSVRLNGGGVAAPGLTRSGVSVYTRSSMPVRLRVRGEFGVVPLKAGTAQSWYRSKLVPLKAGAAQSWCRPVPEAMRHVFEICVLVLIIESAPSSPTLRLRPTCQAQPLRAPTTR